MVEVCLGSGRKENLKKYYQKNSSKAIYINYYNDSINEIGEPKIPVTVTRDIQQRWKETYDGLFKNFKRNKENNTNIELDENFYEIYKEAKIDHELKLFNEFKDNNRDREDQKKNKYQKEKKTSSTNKFKKK